MEKMRKPTKSELEITIKVLEHIYKTQLEFLTMLKEDCVEEQESTAMLDYEAMLKESKILSVIIAFGVGIHKLEVVHRALEAADLAPMEVTRMRFKPRIAAWSSPTAQEFYSKVLSLYGTVFNGFAISLIVEEDDLITSIQIRH